MEPKIIFEDEYFLVIDKPSGWVVNRAKSVKGETIQDWVEKRVSGVSRVVKVSKVKIKAKLKTFRMQDAFRARSGVVHRLDKETSGCLIVAKTKDAFENLQAQFKARKVEKTYTALVHGKVEPKDGVVNAPVGRLPWNRERFGVLAGGRPAKTRYETIKQYNKTTIDDGRKKNFSLLKLHPETGRTHQIRIHLKHLGYPIVSDSFYAGRKTARSDRKWCSRLFLHAGGISFKHPKTKKTVTFKSSLPVDLKVALKHLSSN